MSKTKIIHFTVGDHDESAEFADDTPTEDVKDCFRSAAEAGPYDILKLYNNKGNLVNISPNLTENDETSRYRVEVVAAHCGHCGKDLHGVDVEDIDRRLKSLERNIFIEHGSMPEEFAKLRDRVDEFKEKLEHVEHLSWLGLFKEIDSSPDTPIENGSSLSHQEKRKRSENYHMVLKKFLKMGCTVPSEVTIDHLRRPSFDNWQWEDAEMLFLVQQMYVDLKLVETFHIEIDTLQQFLYEVYRNYNQIPFHNFRHCFCVTQMMYGMICLSNLHTLIEKHEVLLMLTAALCHDLDHPGYNNAYQVNARTELAIRYNDISPLENHHASIAFDILSRPNTNILKNLEPDVYKKVRDGMIKSILATDMARHSEILNKFKGIMATGFDFKNDEHRLANLIKKVSGDYLQTHCGFYGALSMNLMMIFIKVADISNEARPMEVAEPWLDCLLQEFFNQSDIEKLEGLPVAPFMDREKVTKSSAQIGFVDFVLLPLIKTLVELFPVLEEHMIKPVNTALKYYQELSKAADQERQKREDRRSSTVNAPPNGKMDSTISDEKPPERKISNGHATSSERKLSRSSSREL